MKKESKVVQVLHEYEKLKFEGDTCGYRSTVAFSIGEVIGDTLIVHIEKAQGSGGVYEAINQFIINGRKTPPK